MRQTRRSTVTQPAPVSPPTLADAQPGDRADTEPAPAHHAAPLLSRGALRYFIRLRWLFLLTATTLLLLETKLVGARRPTELWLIIALLALLNLVWRVVLRRTPNPPEDDLRAETRFAGRLRVQANLQIGFDLLALTTLLRYSGGAQNPLAIFYVFHMAIGSLLLPPVHAAAHGVFAVAIYSATMLAECSGWLAPHFPLLPHLQPDAAPADLTRCSAMILTTACGVIGTLYFTSHSAAALRQRERRLSAVNEDLERSQLAISDLQRRRSLFMQTAAHQLKSPLAGVQTLAQLIRDGIVVGAEVLETCDLIIRRCQDGILQVTKLLTLARVQDADPQSRIAAASDLCAVVRQQCQLHAPLAEGRRIALACQGDEDGPILVPVHPDDLADCLGNLIDNAIKYTPDNGRVRVVVVPHCRPDREPPADYVSIGPTWRPYAHGCAAVRVIDTGIGIDPALLQAPGGHGLFEAFRRGRNAALARIPGTGLGLSIVREVIEKAGGQIQVRSIAGSGSQFTVVLPTVAGTSPHDDDRIGRARTATSAPPTYRLAAVGGAQETTHA